MKYDNKKIPRTVQICNNLPRLLKVKVRVTHRSWVNIDLWNQSHHKLCKIWCL